MDLILKGIVTGFILSIMIGPVFFVLLETSIRRGVRAALTVDIGVFLSDVIYVLIAYIFYSQVSAIVSGENESASAKKRIMRECGIHVVDSPAEIGAKMAEALGVTA